jgi:hypothetical protein
MSFKHLKAGDEVYLVHQSKRLNPAGYIEVVRVGRKYGYIERYGRPEPFDLFTGRSVHGADSNARSNGHGFDVWPSEEAYRAHIVTIEANIRLVKRLKALCHGQYSSTLDKASPELVADLHAVLDRHGA